MVRFCRMLYSFYQSLNCEFCHFSWPFQLSLLSGSSSPSLNSKSSNNLRNSQPLLRALPFSRKAEPRKQKNQVPGIHGWEATEVGRPVIAVKCKAWKMSSILFIFLQNIPGSMQKKRSVGWRPRRERASELPVESNPLKARAITSWQMVSYSKWSVIRLVIRWSNKGLFNNVIFISILMRCDRHCNMLL